MLMEPEYSKAEEAVSKDITDAIPFTTMLGERCLWVDAMYRAVQQGHQCFILVASAGTLQERACNALDVHLCTFVFYILASLLTRQRHY